VERGSFSNRQVTHVFHKDFDFFSLSEGTMPAVWEDITDAIAMTILNGSATLLVTVSARYINVCSIINQI